MKSRNTGTTKTKKRILIMDDHPITRQGLVQLLNREPDLIVCGEADNGTTALAMIKSHRPDLILADLSMPGKSALEFIREVGVFHPDVKVLVLSMHDETIYAERILKAGARGYVMKSESGEKLVKAIRRVFNGEFSISDRVSGALLSNFSGRRSNQTSPSMSALTSREFEVFQLIGEGLGTREIGERLHISGKTIETHRMHLKEKLNLKSGSELVSHAVRWAVANQLV